MKISHETPLDLLDLSLTFNDYQYLLPHYWDKYPKYKEFFKNYRKKEDSFIILDNGLFEGGVFPEKDLIRIINEIEPDIFIVPDSWNNAYTTFESARNWMDNIRPNLPSKTKLMIVLQGRSFADLDTLVWDSMKMGYRHIAFNHSSLAYSEIYPHSDPAFSKMMGRMIAFNMILNGDIFDKFKKCYIHFLGVSLPQEMIYSANKQFISSIDTSNPVIVGIKGKKYGELGIDFKPEEKIEKFMEENLASSLDNIIFNINKFKKWTL